MKILAIGDVHGCGEELQQLIRDHPADQIHLVGDLFDRGPRPDLVVKTLQHENVFTVLGNHDDKLLRSLDGRRKKALPQHYRTALDILKSKNVPIKDLQEILEKTPTLRELSPQCIIAHAAVNIQSPNRIDAQLNVDGDEACKKGDDQNAWWEKYQQEPLIIYGHKVSNQGPRLRYHPNGCLNSIGLDTGAVFGGHLTGYLFDLADPGNGTFPSIPCPVYFQK
jgi:hypothetical protein